MENLDHNPFLHSFFILFDRTLRTIRLQGNHNDIFWIHAKGEVNENDIIQHYVNRNSEQLVNNDNNIDNEGNNGDQRSDDLDSLDDSVLYTNVAFSQKEPVLEIEKGMKSIFFEYMWISQRVFLIICHFNLQPFDVWILKLKGM